HIGLAFRDWRIYVAGVIYFGLNASLASTSAFLPTIIKTFGYSNANSQLLTVPSYAVAAVVLTTSSAASDRLQSRGVFMMAATALGGIGYLCSRMRVVAHNLGSETKKATGIPMFMAIGQCGSVYVSNLTPKD
ncbi:hypothetical protein MPER_01025, partial [Moniliophthora perniciosa FA553]